MQPSNTAIFLFAMSALINAVLFFWYLPWYVIIGSLGIAYAYGHYMGANSPDLLAHPLAFAPNILMYAILALMYYPGLAVAFYFTTTVIAVLYCVYMSGEETAQASP